MHLVGFIIRIYLDARFSECQIKSERPDQLSANYSVSTVAHSLWVRRSRREAYHLSPSSAEFKI
jgi:hypothetical protein